MQPEGRDGGYRFGPFRLDSEIDLAPLRLRRRHDGLPVQIRLGPVDLGATAGIHVSSFITAGPQVCSLSVPGLARFAVLDGRRVVVELEARADLGDVRGYLTAWVFGALCHQNGMLPLHASAVERAGVATAFLGGSGAGKSTLAAFLARRGFAVSSDDICLLREAPHGMELVPVAEWIKLWRGTIEALGEQVDGRDRTYSDEDKYRLYPAATGSSGSEGEGVAGHTTELRNLVFVERGEGPAKLDRLSNAATLGRMMTTVYLGYCMGAMQIESRVFAQCARVAGQARGWLLTAPWGFAAMPEVLDQLETQVLVQDFSTRRG